MYHCQYCQDTVTDVSEIMVEAEEREPYDQHVLISRVVQFLSAHAHHSHGRDHCENALWLKHNFELYVSLTYRTEYLAYRDTLDYSDVGSENMYGD